VEKNLYISVYKERTRQTCKIMPKRNEHSHPIFFCVGSFLINANILQTAFPPEI
jgi:hypothetical protein